MKKKILLGMSGGVDSAVSAILLKQKGYEVIGAYLNMLENDDLNDVYNVCSKIGIELKIFDCSEIFKNNVINDFLCEYKNCRTPNPCIECNKYLKFGFMYEKAIELGCDYIATGHYAKIEYDENYRKNVIKKSNNINKDQSYVLWNIPNNILDNIIFPLGSFNSKNEIREIAKKYNLEIANKPDSEDICFIPDGNYRKFLEEKGDFKSKQGNIVLKDGTILGKHNGLYNYTIGQRKGLGIAYKYPLYVIGFNEHFNQVIVGLENELYNNEMLVTNLNWFLFDDLKESMNVKVKTRYTNKEYNGIIKMKDEKILRVEFEESVPRITPGQSAVFYIDNVLIGGGKIIG